MEAALGHPVPPGSKIGRSAPHLNREGKTPGLAARRRRGAAGSSHAYEGPALEVGGANL